jgi:4a-hydroxytetrahydrobiopterin dehydratase
MDIQELTRQRCLPRRGEEHLIDGEERADLLRILPGWDLSDDSKMISKDFRFEDFHRSVGFVNAVAFMANREDHHPDLEVGYGHCRVHWSTHDVGGLSMNDFVCAAKVEGLFA